jgi:hypothetical protein
MNQILPISYYSGQVLSMNLSDGTSFSMTMVYKPLQYGWFIQSLTYKAFTVQGIRVTVGVNILRQFANQIPFGLGCSCQGREPTQKSDFTDGSAQLFVLTSDEVEQYEEFINGI